VLKSRELSRFNNFFLNNEGLINKEICHPTDDLDKNIFSIYIKKATQSGGLINNSGNMVSYKVSEKSVSPGVVGANMIKLMV
jgi:hypothetical protein